MLRSRRGQTKAEGQRLLEAVSAPIHSNVPELQTHEWSVSLEDPLTDFLSTLA